MILGLLLNHWLLSRDSRFDGIVFASRSRGRFEVFLEFKFHLFLFLTYLLRNGVSRATVHCIARLTLIRSCTGSNDLYRNFSTSVEAKDIQMIQNKLRTAVSTSITLGPSASYYRLQIQV